MPYVSCPSPTCRGCVRLALIGQMMCPQAPAIPKLCIASSTSSHHPTTPALYPPSPKPCARCAASSRHGHHRRRVAAHLGPRGRGRPPQAARRRAGPGAARGPVPRRRPHHVQGRLPPDGRAHCSQGGASAQVSPSPFSFPECFANVAQGQSRRSPTSSRRRRRSPSSSTCRIGSAGTGRCIRRCGMGTSRC